jgi:hypothetical protein
MKHLIKITLTSKLPKAKILHEIELTCNELVERDEDLNIEHEKKKENTTTKGKRKTVGTLQRGGTKKRR